MLGDAKTQRSDSARTEAGSSGLMAVRSRQWLLSVQRLSLVLLVVQNSALVMVMHHSRNSPAGTQPRYLASTAVLLVEVIKLSASLVLATYHTYTSHPSSSPSALWGHLYRTTFSRDSWKLVVPAALYTLQNSLVYTAISNLDAVTFQVTYQLKILTTVLFSIILLGRNISLRQWLGLILLTFGVALVQVSGQTSTDDLDWKERLAALIRGGGAGIVPSSNAFKGLMAVVAASVISGLTCVYFEKLMKDSMALVSLWTRNVQLSFFSLFPALFIGVLWQDGVAISKHGFFAGYNTTVWATICLQALGGLIVAVCIAYADNVVKNFAASLSIVVSYTATAIIFKTPVTIPSTLGALVVILATYLYKAPRSVPTIGLLPVHNSDQQTLEKVQRSPLLQPTSMPDRQ